MGTPTIRTGNFNAVTAPLLATLSALGRTWQSKNTTGAAALTALPTTTAGFSLYNGEATTTNTCYVIHSFGSWEAVVDATQADTTAIFAMMNTGAVSAPTDGGFPKSSLSGAPAYSGLARTAAALTVTNNNWYAHGPTSPMPSAVAGANWKVNECTVNGLYIVQPGGLFSICAVKAAAAAAAQQFYFIRWIEVQLPWA